MILINNKSFDCFKNGIIECTNKAKSRPENEFKDWSTKAKAMSGDTKERLYNAMESNSI